MNNKKFSLSDRGRSFLFAFQGLSAFFRTQHNAWIHAFVAIITILSGFYFGISRSEWLWIIVAIALVFITEMLNTALEFLCDHISKEIHPQIKKVKDIAAAAVLVSSVAAIVIGLIVFYPYILSLLNS